jgi:hypothetical protein
MGEFGRANVLQRRWPDLWFDHSIFALMKILWRHLPAPQTMSKILTGYMAVAAIAGTSLFFLRIRHLPVPSQVLCLATAAVLLPPTSADYTLIHLYVPWALLAFVAIDSARAGQRVPGLGPAFVCFAILLSPENEIFIAHERIEGALKAVTLIALWCIALRYPFGPPHVTSEAKGQIAGRSAARSFAGNLERCLISLTGAIGKQDPKPCR